MKTTELTGAKPENCNVGDLLYTRPDDKLRKAAEEFAHVASMTKVKFDNDEHKAVFAEAYENLRAALEKKRFLNNCKED